MGFFFFSNFIRNTNSTLVPLDTPNDLPPWFWSSYLSGCNDPLLVLQRVLNNIEHHLDKHPFYFVTECMYTLTLLQFFNIAHNRLWTLFIDFVFKFRTFWVKKMTKSVHKQKSYDIFRFCQGCQTLKHLRVSK